MLSSPEPALDGAPETTFGWEPAELRPGAVPSGPLLPFQAQTDAGADRPSLFEVSQSAGIPEDLLAPARVAAQSVGYAAGWTSGVRAARVIADAEAQAAAIERERVATRQDDQLDRAIRAIRTAATALEHQAIPAAEEVEELIVSTALAIAEALVGQVLRDGPVRSQAALTRVLNLAPVDEDVTIALSPADLPLIDAESLSAKGESRVIAFVEDPALPPGDAWASCGATTIDARLTSGLERVRQVLGR